LKSSQNIAKKNIKPLDNTRNYAYNIQYTRYANKAMLCI